MKRYKIVYHSFHKMQFMIEKKEEFWLSPDDLSCFSPVTKTPTPTEQSNMYFFLLVKVVYIVYE